MKNSFLLDDVVADALPFSTGNSIFTVEKPRNPTELKAAGSLARETLDAAYMEFIQAFVEKQDGGIHKCYMFLFFDKDNPEFCGIGTGFSDVGKNPEELYELMCMLAKVADPSRYRLEAVMHGVGVSDLDGPVMSIFGMHDVSGARITSVLNKSTGDAGDDNFYLDDEALAVNHTWRIPKEAKAGGEDDMGIDAVLSYIITTYALANSNTYPPYVKN